MVRGMKTIPTSEVRDNLAEIIKGLPDTGPVTLTRHDTAKAVLSLPPDPAAELEQFRATAATLTRLAKWCDNASLMSPTGALDWVAGDYKLTTPQKINDFLDAIQRLEDTAGIKLTAWELEGVEMGEGEGLPELMARMLLAKPELNAITAARQDFVEWSKVIAEVSAIAGRKRQDRTDLMIALYDDRYEPNAGDTLIHHAISAGLDPASFRTRAVELIDSGVDLGDIHEALGKSSLPTDILAADSSAPLHLEELLGAGLPEAEGLVLMRAFLVREEDKDRRGNTPSYRQALRDAQKFAFAGAREATQVLEMAERGYDMGLVDRAAKEGLTPKEWVPLLDRIGSKRKYNSLGVLPLRVLAEAADRNMSLKAWDDNPHTMNHPRPRSQYDYQTPGRNLDWGPWPSVYPDRVTELAAAKVSPGLVAECWQFFTRTRGARSEYWNGPGDVAGDILQLREAGLTLPLLKELARTSRGVTHTIMSVQEVLRALELGITAATIDHFRLNITNDSAWWLDEMERWRAHRQDVADFLAGQQSKPDQWKAVTELGNLVEWVKDFETGNASYPLIAEAASLIAANAYDRLHLLHLQQVDRLIMWVVNGLREEDAPTAAYREAVDEAAARRFVEELRAFLAPRQERTPLRAVQPDAI